MSERLLDTTTTATSFDPAAATAPLPERARIVVIGAGVVGASVAYHLARLGERDVLLLERDRIASGSSWHAAGLVVKARATHALTELASYGIELYAGLEAETGVDVGLKRPGSLTLARTPGRWDELRYGAAVARHHGIPAHEVSPREVEELWPLATGEGLVGGLHQPLDGYLNPGLLAQALAAGAHAAGATVREDAAVTRLVVVDGRVTGVETARGTVACERVVLACGLWTRDLAASVGAAVPLYAAEHVHVQTAPIDGASDSLGVLRDLDGYLYVRHLNGTLLVGAFEPDGKPLPVAALGERFAFGELAADWEHFAPIRRNAEARVPALRDTTWERFLCAPESFTPDAAFCLGETSEVDGLFVAAGFNSQGIIYAGGAGLALAEWLVEGAPTRDLVGVDVRRFARQQANRRYLHARTVEGLGRLYAMHWPHLQPTTARNVRRTPLHARTAAAGAVFGEAVGWERANWYAPPLVERTYAYAYGRQNWFEHAGEEHRAAREAAALFDLSSFTKIEVAGADACAVVQRICARSVDIEPGRLVYTLMLTPRGGIDLDGTVVRLAADRLLVITPTVSHAATLGLLRRAARGRNASVFDATAGLATLAVMGPASRELLGRITPDDLSDEAFPFGAARELEIGDGHALALRVSFVGELGWELYPTADLAIDVYDAVIEAGSDLGLRNAGYHALDSLRAEKGFRHLGHDIGFADDPYEASLGFLVDLDVPGGFTGRDALAARAGTPPRRRQRYIRLDDPQPLLLHDESILLGDRIVGTVTSGAYGYTLGAACGLCNVTADVEPGSGFHVDVMGARVPATISARPFYDPTGSRMRG